MVRSFIFNLNENVWPGTVNEQDDKSFIRGVIQFQAPVLLYTCIIVSIRPYTESFIEYRFGKING